MTDRLEKIRRDSNSFSDWQTRDQLLYEGIPYLLGLIDQLQAENKAIEEAAVKPASQKDVSESHASID